MRLKFTTLFFCIVLLFSYSAFACSCSNLETTSNKYQQADFVGIVKIIKTYKNDSDSIDRYKVDVETTSLLKGKAISTLVTEGFNQVPNRWSSCGVGFTEGKSYLVYGDKTDKNIFIGYCGVTRYNMDRALVIINKIKPHVGHFKVDTRWGRTTYIPYQLYLKYVPDSAKHLSLIKIDIDKKHNRIDIEHLTNDDKGFIETMKKALTESVNWKSKLDEKYYPNDKYTFILEIHPYTSSLYIKEQLEPKN